jgi:hypothetical protein
MKKLKALYDELIQTQEEMSNDPIDSKDLDEVTFLIATGYREGYIDALNRVQLRMEELIKKPKPPPKITVREDFTEQWPFKKEKPKMDELIEKAHTPITDCPYSELVKKPKEAKRR